MRATFFEIPDKIFNSAVDGMEKRYNDPVYLRLRQWADEDGTKLTDIQGSPQDVMCFIGEMADYGETTLVSVVP